jgi:rhamnosyltransferase
MDKINITVAVLMATYNGEVWLKEQIDSILEQKDVDVTLFVSDDASTDGSYNFLELLAKQDSRIVLLPKIDRMGSAGKNFYRLLSDVSLNIYDYVAFADQDDIWYLSKLKDSISAIRSQDADGYSSDVLAFWPNGREFYVKKSYRQKDYDYMFEAPGPGCTFVLSKKLALHVQSKLLSNTFNIRSFFHHDWLVYAIARSNGFNWVIDNKDSMRYRQHKSNETGVNKGYNAFKLRILKLKNSWYLDQVYLLAKILGKEDLIEKIIGRRGSSRIKFIYHFLNCRRRFRDCIFLLFCVLLKLAK